MDDDEREHDHSETTTSTYRNSSSINKLPFMDKFSRIAFQGMSIKLMMTDPVDNYLMGPLSEAFADLIDFKRNLLFISANMVSYAGVVAALVAARLVTYDSSTLHKLSFVMFQLRTWLDDLDGVVARSRMGIYKHVSLSETSGYVVDGLCDAIGFVAYIIGCYIYMKRTLVNEHRRRRRQQRLLSTSSEVGYNLQSITEIKTAAYLPLVQRGAKGGNDETDSENGTNNNSLIDSEEEQILHDTISAEVAMDDQKQQRQADESPNNQRKDNELIEVPKGLLSRNTTSRRIFFTTRLGKGHHPTYVIFYRYIKEKIKHNLNNRRSILLTLCFLLQLAICSTFWNRYILIYKDLLESTSTCLEQSRAKRKIIKSNIMYILIWFWRLTNGHSFMQLLIGSVFIGKLWQFLDFIKYAGFVEIIFLASLTELHVIDVRNYLAEC